MPNRLINETSPYLLQHANNPVDWYPWGDEALTKSKDEDKPILVSIGYSACHWCHVMAHESFEDEGTARIMNELFINIKVDREERPDLDSIYMQAVQAMTGRGGWPMTVFLTPDLVPFFGGTYYPPTPRFGMPSFQQVLQGVASTFRDRRGEIEQTAQRLREHISHSLTTPTGDSDLRVETLDAAYHALARQFDAVNGGFGDKPKFPPAMALEFLLRMYHRTKWPKAWEMIDLTLRKMARGGMYDQLGGGFHRYSVDERWLVPHFEKMLYDNSQLVRVYLHAWQVTGDALFRAVTEEILDYVVREMTYVGARANDQQFPHTPKLPSNATDTAGGVAFYSTQDADSEGEEGRFFVWTPDEIREVLGSEADAFMAAYGVTRQGNASTGSAHGFEAKNILEFVGDAEQRQALAKARRELFQVREQRVRPGRDDKVITSWNGLMLAAFAEAARALDRDDYRRVAEGNADFLLHELRTKDGRLLHTWKAGRAKQNGFLEDYSYLIEGLLELYQTTFESRWFVAARELAETMIAHFGASDGHDAGGITGFYDTSDDHEALITRPRGLQDNATPSGNAMAITVLLKLAGFTNDLRYLEIAQRGLAQVQSLMAQYPLGFGQWLQALSYALSEPKEIAIIGDPESGDTRALLSVVRNGYRPFQVVALGAPSAQPQVVPTLQDRGLVEGRAAVYVCDAPVPGRAFICQAPVTDAEALQVQLQQGQKLWRKATIEPTV
jgi:uncharacterized protein YyaL (SSP411 family)